MSGMISLHQIAAARGDGLRREILDLLLARQSEASQPNVADLAAWRSNGWVQAGPNPTGDVGSASKTNVVRIAPSEVARVTKARRVR